MTGLQVFETPQKAARALADELRSGIKFKDGYYFLAVSGGSTPKILFNELSGMEFKDSVPWEKVHLFWCDERCVPPDDAESNYGMTKKSLLDKISIPEDNIHRIIGEASPEDEAERYGREILKIVPYSMDKMPRFDRMLLGMGTDGHTASLFPGRGLSNEFANLTGLAVHPGTGQKRISFTSALINNSKKISFFVTGKEKAKTLSEIINHKTNGASYPAESIKPCDGIVNWIIDKEAAFYL